MSVIKLRRQSSFRSLVVSLVSGGLVGKAAGVARELVLAGLFGTSPAAAAFRVAQTTTLVPLNLVTSDALNSGFLPLYQRSLREGGTESDKFYRCTQTLLLVLSCAVAAALILGADVLVRLFAPGLQASTAQTAAMFVRIMALGVPFYITGSMNSFLALSHQHPRLVSIRATTMSVWLLAGTLGAGATGSVALIAWGFSAGCLFYSAYGFIYVRRHSLLQTKLRREDFSGFFSTLSPLLRVVRGLLLIPILVQINEVLERVFSSLLGEDVVAATEYANFIVDTAVTIIAVPVGLGALAALGGSSDVEQAARDRARVLTPLILALSLPCSVVLSMKAVEATALLYERGQFSAESTAVTAIVLQGFAVGLWAQVLGYIFVKLYSGTLRTVRVVISVGAGMFGSIATLAISVPTGNAIFIGLAGSAYGLVATVVSARYLGIGYWLLRHIGLYLPGALVLAALCLCWPMSGVLGFLVLLCSAGLVWVGYLLLVAPLRRATINVVFRARQSEGDVVASN